ncbi:MAG: glycoside hydrolase family 32 protein, partial [Lachnospiraceae bacterium]|nr:glycoside hydrolase family 32 protein [Lachnospiraceae bacterium]
MISQTLRDARRYEETMERKIGWEEKPDFHLSTRVGWMNDPNGFSFYKGEYHMFYQYHPYDSHWGPMHWGHAVSKDLLHWEYLPAALAPDMDYDRDGCFSGSAVVLPDGRQLLMYTGVAKETQPDGGTREIQTQC